MQLPRKMRLLYGYDECKYAQWRQDTITVNARREAFYVFTSEIEGVDEGKLKVAGDVFSVNTLVANKGDKVTVHFYNVDPVKEERHSFTMGDPYAANIDLGFAESGNATFTADNVGVFPFYCEYHLPVMEGQLVVLP